MPTEHSDGQRPRAARGPFLLSLVLVLALAGALYLLYTQHARKDAWANAEQLAQEDTRGEALAAEKSRLEDLLKKSPCDALQLLRGAAASPLGAPAVQSGTPATPAAPAAPPSAAQQEQKGQGTPAAPAGQAGQDTPAAPVTQQGQNAPSSSAAAAANDPAALLEKACVFIVCADGKNGLSTGSGFFVAPGYVVTNDHVVNKAVGRILITSRALGTPVQGTLVAHTSENGRDYALLRIPLPQGVNITAPAFSTAARRTDKIGTWGFPHVIGQNDPAYKQLMSGSDISAVPELAYSEGVVSAILQRTPPLVVHTAPISPGNSGGPLVNAKGEIVGINTMITLDEDSYRQASIALAASDLLLFLQSCGVNAAVSAQ